MVAAIRRVLNGHAKLVYAATIALAVLAAFVALVKSSVDDWFTRVTRAAVLAPQHEDWIQDHDAWSQQRNEKLTDGFTQLATDVAVLARDNQYNKELAEQGFQQVLGVLTDVQSELRVMNSRMFDIQGRLRADLGGEPDGVGAQR